MSYLFAVTRRTLLTIAAVPSVAGGKQRSVADKQSLAGPLPLVMLDPGHGGKDPGAIGVRDTYEKHVAFAVAQELRRQLLQAGSCRVALTRMRDNFVALDDRVAIGQERSAALFVSLHADWISDPSIRGASVYTLSEHASDTQTADLAQRENGADRVGGPSFLNVSPAVADILSSLMRDETRARSAYTARMVVSALEARIELLTNPSRHAHFRVLRAANIPSILVEMGFMSNTKDEADLRRAGYRSRVAGALTQAIATALASRWQAAHVAAG